MTLRERGGGADGGGGNANNTVLLRQAGEDDKGLLFSARGADDSWHLRGEAKAEDDPPVGGHIDLRLFPGPGVDRVGYLRLQFPADVTGFAGADSNNIRVRLFRNDSFVRSPTVVWTAASGLLVILLGSTVTASSVRTAIDGLSDITIENSIEGAGLGSDTLVLPTQNNQSSTYNLRGGSDTIPAGIELLALPDDAVHGSHILVKYDAGDQDLQGLLDELEENDQGVSITVPYGTDLTAAPEDTPFVRGFYEGDGGEAPSTGTGGLTQEQVDGRVRVLAKGYALRGGPDVPDSEIGDEITRDNEVKPYALQGGGQVPDGDIPEGIARDLEIKNFARQGGGRVPESEIDPAIARDSEIKPYAKVGGGQVPDSDIPGSITRDSEIEPWAKPGGGDVPEDRIPDEIARDTEIKLWARVGGGNVPEGQIDDRIARDSEVEAGDAEVLEHTLASQRFESGEFITVTQGGTERRTAIPTGGTEVTANPAGEAGDQIDRISIAGVDYNLPNPTVPDIGRTEQIEFQDQNNFTTGSATEITPAASNPISVVSGDGDASLLSDVSGNDFTLKAGLYIVEAVFEARADGGDGTCKLLYRNADDNSLIRSTSSSYLGRSSEGWQELTKIVLIRVTQDTAINAAGQGIRAGFDLRNLVISFTELSGSARTDSSITPTPSISSYTLVTGEQSPVAGSIAGKRYNLAWQIAQSDHVGSARILGFKGAYGDGTDAVVLRNIDGGASTEGHPNIGWANGETGILLPNGLTLADGETYTFRLQVFEEGVTSPSLTQAPIGYQDIVITAHAAATANYHWGRLPYAEGRTAAQYAALIDFSNNDLQTDTMLDTTDGYAATPAANGSWVFYLAAKDGETQPASWVDHNGLPASSAFEAVVDQSIDSVDFKVYVMSIQRQASDGSQQYIPRT